MLGKVTLLSTIEVQPTESRIQFVALKDYLINTSNITRMQVYNTTDTLMRYKLDLHEDRTFPFSMIVNETNAAIQILGDVSALSTMIALSVFEDALSFSECTGTPVTKYFNVEDISWAEDNTANTISKIWVQRGGWGVKSYYVNANIDQIYDSITTGTTTTTTSSSTSTTTAA